VKKRKWKRSEREKMSAEKNVKKRKWKRSERENAFSLHINGCSENAAPGGVEKTREAT
jgi:hypothetical protein